MHSRNASASSPISKNIINNDINIKNSNINSNDRSSNNDLDCGTTPANYPVPPWVHTINNYYSHFVIKIFERSLVSCFPSLAHTATMRKFYKVFKTVLFIVIVVKLLSLNRTVREWCEFVIFGDIEAQENEIMKASLAVPTDPLQCKHSRSLETSPSLLKRYGPVDENWCELITLPGNVKNQKLRRKIKTHSSSSAPYAKSSSTTYFTYPGSNNETEWPYFQCPIRHQIKCNGNNRATNKKTRALIIYMVPTATNPYQAHQETANLNFFLKHGLVPANTGTALFDSVDFVFAKIQLEKGETQDEFLDCGTVASPPNNNNKKKQPKQHDSSTEAKSDHPEGVHNNDHDKDFIKNNTSNSNRNKSFHRRKIKKDFSNIRFFMIPMVPCDLCAHTMVIDKISKEEGGEINYDQVIMLNGGIRGPFFEGMNSGATTSSSDHSNNHNHQQPITTWIDFVAMSGRRKIPNPRSGFFAHSTTNRTAATKPKKTSSTDDNSYDDQQEDCPIHISTSTTISWETKVHHQSFFLSVPIEILKRKIHPTFKKTCLSRLAMEHYGVRESFDDCIVHGEVKTGSTILGQAPNWAMYGLAKQMYVHDKIDSAEKRQMYYHPKRNPTMAWTDPCKTIFPKVGGLVFKKKQLQKGVLKAVDMLTRGMMMPSYGSVVDVDVDDERDNNDNEHNNDHNHEEERFSSSNNNRRTSLDEAPWDWQDLQEMFFERGCEWRW